MHAEITSRACRRSQQDLATVVGDRDAQELADDVALRGPVRRRDLRSAVSKRPLYIRPPRDAM